MVVLVPFLLITAVFSRVAIMELSLPTGAGSSSDKQELAIEVIVRQKGLEIGNGKQVLARFPLLKPEDINTDVISKNDGDVEAAVEANVEEEEGDISLLYDVDTLSKYLKKIKAKYPDKTDALVLMEADIEYRVLIRVMDAVRSAFVRQQGAEGEADVMQQVVLFPDISIGDAP
jgi:biopolymer transport protein ExbD